MIYFAIFVLKISILKYIKNKSLLGFIAQIGGKFSTYFSIHYGIFIFYVNKLKN
jgi:hypothetical protein